MLYANTTIKRIKTYVDVLNVLLYWHKICLFATYQLNGNQLATAFNLNQYPGYTTRWSDVTASKTSENIPNSQHNRKNRKCNETPHCAPQHCVQTPSALFMPSLPSACPTTPLCAPPHPSTTLLSPPHSLCTPSNPTCATSILLYNPLHHLCSSLLISAPSMSLNNHYVPVCILII